MRYDDRIETALAWPPGDAAARDRLWIQLIDLIALGGDAAILDRAIKAARDLRGTISAERRRETAVRAVREPISAALVALFAEEADIGRSRMERALAAARCARAGYSCRAQ